MASPSTKGREDMDDVMEKSFFSFTPYWSFNWPSSTVDLPFLTLVCRCDSMDIQSYNLICFIPYGHKRVHKFDGRAVHHAVYSLVVLSYMPI